MKKKRKNNHTLFSFDATLPQKIPINVIKETTKRKKLKELKICVAK
jgi:hypothetical protein